MDQQRATVNKTALLRRMLLVAILGTPDRWQQLSQSVCQDCWTQGYPKESHPSVVAKIQKHIHSPAFEAGATFSWSYHRVNIAKNVETPWFPWENHLLLCWVFHIELVVLRRVSPAVLDQETDCDAVWTASTLRGTSRHFTQPVKMDASMEKNSPMSELLKLRNFPAFHISLKSSGTPIPFCASG